MAGFYSHRSGTGLLSKSSSDMSEPPLRASRGGGSSVLRKDLESNPVPGLRLLWGRRVHLEVQQCHAWGLNGTLLHWALFPDEAVPEGTFRSCGEIGTVLAVKSPNQSSFHRNLYWGSLLRNLDLDYRFTVASIGTPMVTGGWYELSLLWGRVARWC